MSRKRSTVCATSLSSNGQDCSDPENAQHNPNSPTDPSRRSFLGKAGGLTAVALAAAIVPLEPLLGGKESRAEASVIPYQSGSRADASLVYRENTATAEHIDIGVLPDNGDAARFTDHSAQWHKALVHDDLEIVNQASWNSFVTALTSGSFADFQKVIVGNPGSTNFTGTLNGPMASYAFDLEGLDSHATSVPPSPSVTSAQEAVEEVEHYWAALLRDVSFIDYPTNPTVALAVTDMNRLSFVQSGANQAAPFPVTPFNLFRGQTVKGDGNVQGPFLSQFMIQPTFYGAQPLNQKVQTFLPGQDFMTTVDEFKRIQNGQVPSASVALDPTFRFLRDGRDLAAFTRADVLHNEYLTAAFVLLSINAPLNPGNPYIGSPSQHGFGTLGGPDALGTIPEMATRALKGVWFHKWVVNLRHRPENYGALVHARLTNRAPFPQAAGALHPDVLNSAVLPLIKLKFGSFLLPQAFPEGAPSHPSNRTRNSGRGLHHSSKVLL